MESKDWDLGFRKEEGPINSDPIPRIPIIPIRDEGSWEEGVGSGRVLVRCVGEAEREAACCVLIQTRSRPVQTASSQLRPLIE